MQCTPVSDIQKTHVVLGLTPVDSDVHCQTDLPCRGFGGPPADAGDLVPVMTREIDDGTPHLPHLALFYSIGTPMSSYGNRLMRAVGAA